MGSAESSNTAQSQEDSDIWWTGPLQRAASRPERADTLETLVRQVAELKEQLCAAERARRSMQDPGGGGGGDGDDDDGGGSFESNAQRRQHELDLLKRDLSLKREARQKKISAVTAEMDRLRSELASERAERIRLERQLGSGTKSSVEREPFNTTEELCKVREDLATERRVRDAVTAERDQLTSHNKQLLATFEKTSDELRRERANNEALVVDNEKMSAVIAEGEVCIEGMRVELDKAQAELREVRNQVLALKDVAAISAQMLAVREVQVKDMKHKLTEIEAKIKRDSVETAVSSLREEYETQIKNIKDLKQLYEDRARALETEKQKLLSVLEEKKTEVDTLKAASEELDAKVKKLEDQLREESDKSLDLELQLGDSVAECKSLNNQMSRINELFTQMLIGAVTANGMNLDKMSRLLHENHDLIADITSKGCGTDHAPALPKLILDLLNQIERENSSETEDVSESSNDDVDTDDIIVDVITVDDDEVEEVASTATPQPPQHQPECQLPQHQPESQPPQHQPESQLPQYQPESQPQSVEEAGIQSENLATDSKEELVNQISSNLPKVWKVLLELVSQQGGGKRKRRTSLKDDDACYKAVDTPRGPQLVISVSKTYLRLKDLILEKRHLEHELSRLKSLNGHLETRLDEQAQRLSLVQSELHKTWGVVGRMKVQHQQLHTHEKILRYELHQKRELLNELKQELEYCREKWESARQKNSETAREWRQLRKEFAARRARDSAANNSGESGLGEEETSCEEESSVRSDSPVLHQEAQVPLTVAEDIPVQEADMMVASDMPESSTHSSVVQSAEPAQVAIIQETEAEHSTVELHTEQIQVADVRELEPAQVAVFLQMETPQVAVILDSEPTQVAVPVILESPPAQVAVVSQSPTGTSSTATSDECTDDGLSTLKARALVQFTKRSAEYLQEERQEEARSRAPPLALPRRTRMQPARTALQNMSVTPSVFDVTSPNPNQSSSYFFGTRGPARTIDFESDVAPQIERSIDSVLDARAARLQRLEQQAQLLATRVSNTTQRSQMLSSRLEELHEHYGSESPRRSRSRHTTQTPPTTSLPSTLPSPPPPPMPETLPSLRLPTEIGQLNQRDSDDSENPDN